jgi:hypothetical protein
MEDDMPRRLKPGEESKDHPRTTRKRQISLTVVLEDVVKKLAADIAQPGSEPNFSEALRKIIAEWSTGRAHDGTPIRRGRKKSGRNPD